MSWKHDLKRQWMQEGRNGCHWCGKRLNLLPGKNGNLMTIDHVLEQALGGTDDHSNLVPSCGPCNVKRSDKVFGGVKGRATLADVAFEESQRKKAADA